MLGISQFCKIRKSEVKIKVFEIKISVFEIKIMVFEIKTSSKFLQITEFGDFSLVKFGEESGVIIDITYFTYFRMKGTM